MTSITRRGVGLRVAVFVYVMCITLFLEYKPAIMFHEGKPKEFGVKKHQTPFTIFNISTIVSILVLVLLERVYR